jgi:hypothetical protein
VSTAFIGGGLAVTDCVVLLGWSRNSMFMLYEIIGFYSINIQDIFYHLVALINGLVL